MSSKKLINSPDETVNEALLGIVKVNPGLVLLEGHRVVLRCDVDKIRKDKVTQKCFHSIM